MPRKALCTAQGDIFLIGRTERAAAEFLAGKLHKAVESISPINAAPLRDCRGEVRQSNASRSCRSTFWAPPNRVSTQALNFSRTQPGGNTRVVKTGDSRQARVYRTLAGGLQGGRQRTHFRNAGLPRFHARQRSYGRIGHRVVVRQKLAGPDKIGVKIGHDDIEGCHTLAGTGGVDRVGASSAV